MHSDGPLIELKLPDALKLLYHRASTCLVHVESEELVGAIYLERGQVVHASASWLGVDAAYDTKDANLLAGHAALQALLRARCSKYQVERASFRAERTIHESLLGLLTSASQVAA